MNIIFIRHGDPDYINDSLTAKGRKEAKLLAKRVTKWKNADFYCSPLGRARETAAASLDELGIQPKILDWLEEFPARIISPETGQRKVSWDLMPAYWTREEAYFDREKWADTELMKTGNVREYFERVKTGIDSLLAEYGYIRNEGFYIHDPKSSVHKNETAVCFCHFAVTTVIMGHMLNVSPAVLVHGFFLPTTSVTVLCTEEREKGNAYFRCQCMGDTRHLHDGNEPISRSGYFTDIFQG